MKSRQISEVAPRLDEKQTEAFVTSDSDEREVVLSNLVASHAFSDLVDIYEIERLADRMSDARRSGEYPSELSIRNPEGGRFETEFVEDVHRVFSILPAQLLADREFWQWIAVKYFSDTIDWRFRSDDGSALRANYGLGRSGRENMIYRLWQRGEIGLDPETGSYELAISGDQDLWRSHILRQGYGSVKETSRALLRLQNGMLGHRTLRTPEIRLLAKRLKKINDEECLVLLSRQESEALVLGLAEQVSGS